MFRSTLSPRLLRVVLPAAAFACVLVATTTASAETIGEAPVPGDSVQAESVPAEAVPAEAVPVEPVPETPAEAAVPAVAESVAAQGRARMLDFTLKSPQTLDMRGVQESLYRGRFYRTSVEPKRLCVAERESEGHYDVISHNGYYGAYQMSPALARGATWMMLKEHKQLLGEPVAKRVMAHLRATPLNEWPRYWQDAAFFTIYNWKFTGSGAKHWRGGRWHC